MYNMYTEQDVHYVCKGQVLLITQNPVKYSDIIDHHYNRAAPIPILPIFQVSSTAIKCIHKNKHQFQYMVALHSMQS